MSNSTQGLDKELEIGQLISSKLNAVESETDPQEVREFKQSEIIFAEATVSDYAYLILSGDVQISKLVNGHDIEVTVLSAGQVFGEMGLIDNQHRSASARAASDVRLKLFDRETLLSAISQDPEIALPIVKQLILSLRSTSEQFAHNQFLLINHAADDALRTAKDSQEAQEAKAQGFFNADRDLDEFRPDVMVLEQKRLPASARAAVYTIFALFVSVIAWGVWAQIDMSVNAQSRLITDADRIILNSMENAVILSMNVRPGDSVKKGEVLASLDPTFAEADLIAAEQSLLNLTARENRLEAELNDSPLKAFSADPDVNLLETEMFTSRQALHQALILNWDQKIENLGSELTLAKLDLLDISEQVRITTEIEEIQSTLSDSGNGSRLNSLTATNERLRQIMQQRELARTITSLEYQLGTAQSQRNIEVLDRRTRITEELVNTRQQREEMAEQTNKLTRRSSLVEITAPADGVVLETGNISIGSVTTAAEPLFTLVPSDSELVFEVLIAPKDISQVAIGNTVTLRLDSLPFQKHGVILGELYLIGEDTVIDEAQGQRIEGYRARIRIVDNQLQELPNGFRLMSGITGQAQITVGKRRAITYLLYPVMRTFSNSFKEV